jgi:hypothetical protein
MTQHNLDVLAECLASDRDRMRGTGPLWAALSDGSARALYRTIRLLQRSRPETFGVFASEDELFVAIVDAFEPERPQPANLDELAEALRADAHQHCRVAAPLINILPPSEPETVAPETSFTPAHNQFEPIEPVKIGRDTRGQIQAPCR